MIRRRSWRTVAAHAVLIAGVLFMLVPIYVALLAASHTLPEVLQGRMGWLPGDQLLRNVTAAIMTGPKTLMTGGSAPLRELMFNSFVMAISITLGKIATSLLAAFAIVYFRFPFRKVAFWLIFITLMLPVEVRILPTYKVVSDLGMIDTYAGLTLPLIASATATFLFRQFFMSIPDELAEAARIEGAGSLRFLWDVVIPLSRTNIAALFVILFIYGWNQYLWPLLVSTKVDTQTVVVSIGRMMQAPEAGQEWPIVMTSALLAMVPPVLVVVLMQRWFVKGLTDTEK
jgi:sn-glycerol 3-phosphate transport system permease protein